MRLTGGQEGRRTLVSPPGRETRPTSDRVREALFSILGPLPGGAVLDVYAGAGTLGLEALSRGAASALFIDISPGALKALGANIERLGYGARARTLHARAPGVIGRLSAQDSVFQWIFLDPPYFDPSLPETLNAIAHSRLLADDGIVVVEHDRAVILDVTCGALQRFDQRSYGRTVLSFYQHAHASPNAFDTSPEGSHGLGEERKEQNES